MCEIFGICAKNNTQINRYLKLFYSHSKDHPHGWGLGIMDGNEVDIDKEPLQASKSHYLSARLSDAIRVKAAFAHIRYATVGNVEYKNCHPFTVKDNFGRRYTQVHNGTMFDYPPLNEFITRQRGDSDSERVLLYLVDLISRRQSELGRPLDEAERFELLDDIFCGMSEGNKLNWMMFDGEVMYVHTNYAGTLHYLDKAGCVIISTQPLTDEAWRPVPFTRLMAFKDGKMVRVGTNHGNEYVDTEANTRYLNLIFSNL